jgi:general stress protein 26
MMFKNRGVTYMNEKLIAQAEKILADRKRLDWGCLECCVLAQIDLDGYPTAATISPYKIEGIRRIYFCSGLGSNWVKRAQNCNRASVCFSSEEKQYNITLVGTLEIVTDPEIKKEMWYEGLSYHLKGPEDPNYCVLRFDTMRYSLMLNEQDVNGSARGTL